jgi:tRNA 2-selenouridine synthase
VPATRIDIEQFLTLAQQHPVIDVRSPGEYNHAYMPGAHSLPLFTDEERKVVGTAYVQESREQAIKIGLDFFGPKMRKMVEEVESIVRSQNSKTILVYCWRGGMRSGAVSWLLDMYGFKVYTLTGGYKKYRRYVLDTFSLPFNFTILGGYTGSGKTEVLRTLGEKGERVVDLEDIAKHKGSAFGNIGLPKQPGQEMFENLLAEKLRAIIHGLRSDNTHSPLTTDYSPIWLEDESQRIGLVNLPNALWENMRRSPVLFLDISFEERLKHIVEEYGSLDKQPLLDAIGRIREKLGSLNAKTASVLLEEGNTIESFRILLKYYDKFYLKALHNRERLNSLLNSVEFKSVSTENANRLIAEHRYQYEKP